MRLTIRVRLTALYFLVLAASFTGFFWICDYGFVRSIETAVNDASRRNLETVRQVLERYVPQGLPAAQQELAAVSGLWASGAIFEVASSDGQWIYRSPQFPSADPPLTPLQGAQLTFTTTNLELLQYRIARQRIWIGGRELLIDAAVPTDGGNGGDDQKLAAADPDSLA